MAAVALGAGCAAPTAGVQGRFEASTGGRTRTSLENTVVYLLSEKPEPSAPAVSAVLDMSGKGARPEVLAVCAGTRVEIRNRDAVFHMPFSISPAEPFKAEAIPPGEARSVLFEKPGVIHVFCELHPQESAYIYVVPTTRFTRADAHGRFQFAGLAPGSYTLRTWHPENGETSQAVVVPRHGELKVTVAD